MDRPSLESIYKVSATNSRPSLESIYGLANSQTPNQEMGQALSDVGVPNIPVTKPGIIQRGIQAIGKSIFDPLTAIGGGIQNAARAAGRAVGLDTPAVTSRPSLFGGEAVDPVGYRDGQELGPVDTALQGAGNVVMTAANAYTGGEAAPIIAGAKSLVFPALKTVTKIGAIQGAGMGGGEALAEGKSPIEVLLRTGVGSLIGAGAGLTLGVGGRAVQKVAEDGVVGTIKGLKPEVKNPFKPKTVEEILATPDAELGKLSDAERNIYTSNKRQEITKKAQEEIDAIAKRHDEEMARLNTTAQQESAAIRTAADETRIALDAEEKALKEAMATQSIKEAEALKPRLAELIKQKGNEYVKLIDEQMSQEIANSQVTQNEIASSIRKNIQANNPISQQQADEDIATLSKVLKKGATVKDIYETAKQLRADSFGKSAGTSRVLNKDEIQATRLINRLMTFLKDERGVDFTEANKFWQAWAPNRNLLVKKIQPYTASGRENASFNTFARQLVSTNPKDANFIKNLEETFGIKVSDLESRKLLAKLDENAKAKIANDVAKKAKADELRLKKSQDKEGARLTLEVEKGKITQKKADELADLKYKKDSAQLKAEQRKFILNVIKAVTGVSLIGGVVPFIGSAGQGER